MKIIMQIIDVSIHAPRGGSDGSNSNLSKPIHSSFNPRSPWGERPAALVEMVSILRFQSTLPVGGATNVP